MAKRFWIKWNGGDKPPMVIGDIEVKFRDGSKRIAYAGSFFWYHEGKNSDLIAYRPVKSRISRNRQSRM